MRIWAPATWFPASTRRAPPNGSRRSACLAGVDVADLTTSNESPWRTLRTGCEEGRMSAIHAAKTAIAVAALLILTAIAAAQRGTSFSEAQDTAFVCPMHPDYTLEVAGSCPKCGMALVRATPFDVR